MNGYAPFPSPVPPHLRAFSASCTAEIYLHIWLVCCPACVRVLQLRCGRRRRAQPEVRPTPPNTILIPHALLRFTYILLRAWLFRHWLSLKCVIVRIICTIYHSEVERLMGAAGFDTRDHEYITELINQFGTFDQDGARPSPFTHA